MRKLNKGIPYKAFSEFVTENRPTSWDEIKHLTYDMRLYMLCYEQDCLCGYSEIPIGAENTESHIDHFVKQEHDCQKIFSWDNFVVSTVDEDFGGKYKDNTYRIQKNEYALIFNPVVDDMSQYISFLGNGKMIPTNGLSQNIIDKVEKTINVFNLNCQSLKDRRKVLIANLHACSGLSKDEIINTYARSGFVSVLNWFLKTI